MEKDHPSVDLHGLPASERPRERLLRHGPAAVSTVELLAIILRTGSRQENVMRLAERILARFGGLAGLAQATPADLGELHGLGEAKITQVLAALELGRRLSMTSRDERPVIRESADAAQLVSDMANLQQEHVRVILLDASRRLIAISTVYIGTVNATVLRAAEIYREAVARNAPAIILVHNHPSNDVTPSPEDVELTKRLVEAGRFLDIVLLDHLIIGRSGWRSLKGLGLGF